MTSNRKRWLIVLLPRESAHVPANQTSISAAEVAKLPLILPTSVGAQLR
jgi:hypothetical protein